MAKFGADFRFLSFQRSFLDPEEGQAKARKSRDPRIARGVPLAWESLEAPWDSPLGGLSGTRRAIQTKLIAVNKGLIGPLRVFKALQGLLRRLKAF